MSACRSPSRSPKAGGRVLLIDVQPKIVEALNGGNEPHRGRHLRAAGRARRQGARRRERGLRAGEAGARRADRAADAALAPAGARPVLHRARRTQPRAGHPARPGRRARIDHLARHDARDPAADPRGRLGPEGGRRLPPRHVARTRRPGPRGLDDEDDAEGRRRDHARRARRPLPTCTARRSTRCTRSRPRMPRS